MVDEKQIMMTYLNNRTQRQQMEREQQKRAYEAKIGKYEAEEVGYGFRAFKYCLTAFMLGMVFTFFTAGISFIVALIAIPIIIVYYIAKSISTRNRRANKYFSCPKCNNNVKGNVGKCPHCGQKIQTRTYKCSQCGAIFDGKVSNCPVCKKSLYYR